MTKITVKENISDIDFTQPIQRSLVQATQLVRSSSIRNAPVKTGNLRRSITVDNSQIRSWVGIVWTNLIYARIQEFWGIIRPKKAKMLRWKKDGKWYAARQVEIKGKKYMTKALESNRSNILNIFRNNLLK